VSTRAHTVPKFYLNGFVAPGSEREQNPSMWVGSLTSGEITRRSPKNISISCGLYDGRGGFDEQDTTLEAHLAKIESAGVICDTQVYCLEDRNGRSNSFGDNALPGVASGADSGLDGDCGTLGQ
jgi:hypothetical protein